MRSPSGAARFTLPGWILAFSALRVATDREHDLFWMAREGQALLSGADFVHDDVWSWAPVGGNFVPTSPLWQLLLAGAWEGAGRTGLIVLALVTVLACTSATAWLARLLGAGSTATAFALIPALLLGGSAWSARAALPALILLLTTIGMFWTARNRLAQDRNVFVMTVTSVASAAVSTLGIWLHNSWVAYAVVLPGAVLAMTALHAFGSRKRGLLVTLAAAAGASLGASLGPLGVGAWANATEVAEACRGLVVEWSSPWRVSTSTTVVWLGTCLLSLALLPSIRRRDPLRPLRIVLVLGAVAASLAGAYAVRFFMLATIVLVPLVAEALQRGPSPPLRRRLQQLGPRLHEPYWRVIAGLLAIVLLPLSLALLPRAYSRLSDPTLRVIPAGCHVFTDDGAGSVLLLARPDTRSWMDGRLDYWGRARIKQLFAYERGSGRPLVPIGTGCVLLRRNESPRLAAALGNSPQWSVVAESNEFVLWLPKGTR